MLLIGQVEIISFILTVYKRSIHLYFSCRIVVIVIYSDNFRWKCSNTMPFYVILVDIFPQHEFCYTPYGFPVQTYTKYSIFFIPGSIFYWTKNVQFHQELVTFHHSIFFIIYLLFVCKVREKCSFNYTFQSCLVGT